MKSMNYVCAKTAEWVEVIFIVKFLFSFLKFY